MSKELLESRAIIQLKKELTGKGEVKGFKFRQIKDAKSAFLYEVNTGDMIFYEVFRKRINRRFACVSYPTAHSFGIWAWTTPHWERACKLLNELSKNQH